jgi:TetR/AcrR family transcriptional regulator, regulator of biofilm formation and stress response
MYTMSSERHDRPGTAAESRRREILVAALRVITAGGPDAITFRRVAAEAGVPLGSLTYYFESREDLVRESFRHHIVSTGAFLAELENEIPAASPRDLVELLVEMARREFIDSGMVRAEYEMILYAARDPELWREVAAWERSLEARLSANFERMGTARPVEAARTTINLIRGFELEKLARPVDIVDDLRPRLTILINALIREEPTRAPRREVEKPLRAQIKRRKTSTGKTRRKTL